MESSNSNRNKAIANENIDKIAINLEHVKLNEIELSRTIDDESFKTNSAIMNSYVNNQFNIKATPFQNNNTSFNNLRRVLRIFFSIISSILIILSIILIIAILVKCKFYLLFNLFKCVIVFNK
jgi:hypothetical protein